MADRVFGPHVTGISVFGIHIGATVEVFKDSSGGATVPQSLSLVLSPPLGPSATISSIANGQSATVPVTPGVAVTATIENCRTLPAAHGSPELFVFQVTLRAQGSVKVGMFPIPVSLQVGAFDVPVPTDDAVHAKIVAAGAAP